MRYIDAHVHVWTDDLIHYPLGSGHRPEDVRPRRFTPEDLFAHMRRSGVNRAVLIEVSHYYPHMGPQGHREGMSIRIGDGFNNP